jgi:hypothetical protein
MATNNIVTERYTGELKIVGSNRSNPDVSHLSIPDFSTVAGSNLVNGTFLFFRFCFFENGLKWALLD